MSDPFHVLEEIESPPPSPPPSDADNTSSSSSIVILNHFQNGRRLVNGHDILLETPRRPRRSRMPTPRRLILEDPENPPPQQNEQVRRHHQLPVPNPEFQELEADFYYANERPPSPILVNDIPPFNPQPLHRNAGVLGRFNILNGAIDTVRIVLNTAVREIRVIVQTVTTFGRRIAALGRAVRENRDLLRANNFRLLELEAIAARGVVVPEDQDE